MKCLDSEITTRNSVRRSAVSKCKIDKGRILTEDMIIFKRPGNGISPQEIGNYIGKTVICDIPEDVKFLKNIFMSLAFQNRLIFS